jgi:cell division protease FtsH
VNTAIHEVGHTLASIIFESSNEFHKVTIIPRGMALGLTWSTEEEYKVSQSEKQLKTEMRVLLAGRAAEEVIFGKDNVTSGASNDMERCTAIARTMITKFGMNQDLGIVTYGERQGNSFLDLEYNSKNYSEEFAGRIDREVQQLIQTLYAEVKDMLVKHKHELLGLSQELLKHETMDKEEVMSTIEAIQQERFEYLPFDKFEELASSRTPEKIKAQVKEEQEKRKLERERLRESLVAKRSEKLGSISLLSNVHKHTN